MQTPNRLYLNLLEEDFVYRSALVIAEQNKSKIYIYVCLLFWWSKNLVSSVNHFETAKVFSEGKPVTVIPIVDGEQQNIALAPKQDVFITVSSDELKKQKTPKKPNQKNLMKTE